MKDLRFCGEFEIYWDQGKTDDTVNSINNLSKALRKNNPKKQAWQSNGKKRKPLIK